MNPKLSQSIPKTFVVCACPVLSNFVQKALHISQHFPADPDHL